MADNVLYILPDLADSITQRLIERAADQFGDIVIEKGWMEKLPDVASADLENELKIIVSKWLTKYKLWPSITTEQVDSQVLTIGGKKS